MRPNLTLIDSTHPDFPLLSMLRGKIIERAGGMAALQLKFPSAVRDAVDFVLDPVHTARTRVAELDNVEKTFIGLKLEHFVRDFLDVPKGLRDLVIDGVDVDIKNTTRKNWSIPEETYRASEPCLLMAVDDNTFSCSLGLIVAKPEYLHGGKGNRDSKRGVSKLGFKNILWLVENVSFPPSRFDGLDMNRFRALRKLLKGNERAAQFFRENVGRVVHRDVMQALLYDQNDFMKRLRKNGGAPDTLGKEDIAILIGTYRRARELAEALGFNGLKTDEIVGVQPRSLAEWQLMSTAGIIASNQWVG